MVTVRPRAPRPSPRRQRGTSSCRCRDAFEAPSKSSLLAMWLSDVVRRWRWRSCEPRCCMSAPGSLAAAAAVLLSDDRDRESATASWLAPDRAATGGRLCAVGGRPPEGGEGPPGGREPRPPRRKLPGRSAIGVVADTSASGSMEMVVCTAEDEWLLRSIGGDAPDWSVPARAAAKAAPRRSGGGSGVFAPRAAAVTSLPGLEAVAAVASPPAAVDMGGADTRWRLPRDARLPPLLPPVLLLPVGVLPIPGLRSRAGPLLCRSCKPLGLLLLRLRLWRAGVRGSL